MAEKSLNEQMSDERKYYLGRLGPDDTVPGSDKTIAETRKAYREGVKVENARMAKRRDEFFKGRSSAGGGPTTVTTAVTHGVTREIEVPATSTPVLETPEDVATAAVTPHTRGSLKGLKKAELVAIAEGIDRQVVPDSMTNEQIIKIILGETE